MSWDSNTEPDLDGYYIYYQTGTSGALYNGTGFDEGDSPIRVSPGVFADPLNPEYTLHGLSDTETPTLCLPHTTPKMLGSCSANRCQLDAPAIWSRAYTAAYRADV